MDSAAQPVPSGLRQSCLFCRGRKIRCSGGLVCSACQERNRHCVYGPEGRKGRPRRKQTGVDSPLSSSTASRISKDASASSKLAAQADGNDTDGSAPPGRNRTLGDNLELMFNEYFIRKAGSHSDLFQNSIASFLRRTERSSPSNYRPHRWNPNWELPSLALETVEMLLRHCSHLGYEQPDALGRNFYITSLAADSTTAMFDPPSNENPLAMVGKHRIMQLIDLWFSVHPLSPAISKTLLIDAVKDETVDEALLAIILADAYQAYCDIVPDGAGVNESRALFQFATTKLQHRTLSLGEPGTISISTVQALVLVAWRELLLGHARRVTCYVGYTCRMVARLVEWQKSGSRQTCMMLNGVDITIVENEILHNIYWLCLSTTTWAFMQIDQPFSLLVPDEVPGFPCIDGNTSAMMQLDRVTDNISTLHAQMKAMQHLFPLSHIISTVGHIYTLYLNAPVEQEKMKSVPWQMRHIHQLHHLRNPNMAALSSEIRTILSQAIQDMEKEVTNKYSQSFLLLSYHAIAMHMLFPRSRTGQGSQLISASVLHAFCQSASALVAISQRLLIPTKNAEGMDFSGVLALCFDTCSKALLHIHSQSERGSMDERQQIAAMRGKLADHASELHHICQEILKLQVGPVMRPAENQLEKMKLAFQQFPASSSTQSVLSPGDATGSSPFPTQNWPNMDDMLSDPGFSLDQNVNIPFNSDFSTDLPDMLPGNAPLALHESLPEALDPCFFIGDPQMGSFLGFPQFLKTNIHSHHNSPGGQQGVDAAEDGLFSELENSAERLL
ncbi:hypothetical protein MAP00_000930 [Monascus purpureus]|nr:hypothetical protein MAP00_000930 [Monascus purpureus]